MNLFIVIDAQNDFIDGVLGTPEAQKAVPQICDTLESLGKGDMVIFTRDTHYDDYMETLEGQKLPVEHCIYNTFGWDINTDIFSAADFGTVGKIYDKPTFGSTVMQKGLYNMNKIMKIDSITFMGFCTDICVVSNALMTRAQFPDMPIFVKADCCAGTTPANHEAALKVMASCQIEIV
ncbi:MAG: isochorismatase family cysteine hydrolase [Lachnospiraceae bacterium]|nr:isochorismatase family cysteine hydrolase [Lachnospiraceae bacterium]